MFSLQLFGVVCLRDETGPLSGPASHRHRLALLALLAAHGDGLSRDKLAAYLWSERDEKHGRNLLKQAVHVLRHALCEDAILAAGDELRLNARVVGTDLADFEESVARDDCERAVRLYRGDLLDGFFLRDAPEFERWADRERARLADTYARVLEKLAERAEACEDYGSAITSWKARAARDPYDSRVALRLVRALHASGNRAGALRHAAMHEQLLRNDLGIEQTLEFRSVAEPSRREPSPPREPFRPPDDVPNSADRSRKAASAGEPQTRPGRPTGRTMPHLWYGVAALMLLATVYAGIRFVGRRAALRSSGGAVAVDSAGHVHTAPSSEPMTARTSRARRSTQSLAAYELYVRSGDQSLFRSDSGVHLRLQLLREAIALDSDFAAAWAGLGITYARLMVSGTTTIDRQRDFALAERAVQRAITLDDSLAEAHTAMGVVGMMSFDFGIGERELLRAVELDPRRATPHEKLVELYLWLGRPTTALAHADRAVEIEPLSPTSHAQRALALLGNDRCAEALAELDTISQFRPVLLRSASIASQCYARLERWPEAIAVLRAPAERGEPTALAQLAYMYAHSGDKRRAREIRDQLFARWRRGAIGAYALAVADVGVGDLRRAVIWLDRSVADRSLAGGGSNPAYLMLVGPLFEDLRHRPEFERLRTRMGIPAEGKSRT